MAGALNPNPSASSPGASSVGTSQITDGSILDADVNAAAAIATSKLSGAVTSITSHGLGTAATLNVGTGNNNIVQLDGSAKLPAVDGSALTNLASSSPTADGGWFSNIGIVRATTTNTNDSIKITSAGGTALSAGNAGKVRLPSGTLGQVVEFSVTADVTIKISLAHWGADALGDLTASILRVLAINDNGTLRWGVALKGGRRTLLTTDTNATQTNITTGEGVLCTVAVGSSTNTCREIGYFYADFTDSTNLWAVEGNVDSIVVGQIADGLWQPWNVTLTGFSSNPTTLNYRFTQIGKICQIYYEPNSNGTSNATGKKFSVPLKPSINHLGNVPRLRDNSAITTHSGSIIFNSGAIAADVFVDNGGTVSWTASGTCSYYLDNTYEV